jgi:hypothetical protein
MACATHSIRENDKVSYSRLKMFALHFVIIRALPRAIVTSVLITVSVTTAPPTAALFVSTARAFVPSAELGEIQSRLLFIGQ